MIRSFAQAADPIAGLFSDEPIALIGQVHANDELNGFHVALDAGMRTPRAA